MEQIRNFIDLVGQGDNVGAKDALSELLASRAFEALESKKQGIAGTLFNTEEVEQMEEDFTNKKYSFDAKPYAHLDQRDTGGSVHHTHPEYFVRTSANQHLAKHIEKAKTHKDASTQRIANSSHTELKRRVADGSAPEKYKAHLKEEVEDLNEDPSDGGGSDIRHHYNPKGEKPKLGKSGTHVLDVGRGKYKVLQAPASNRLNYGKPVKRGAEITNAHLSDHYEYGRGVVHVHTHNPKEAMMSRADADRHFE
jgi:hypothetical protein